MSDGAQARSSGAGATRTPARPPSRKRGIARALVAALRRCARARVARRAIDEIALRAAARRAARGAARLCSAAPHDRAGHTYGKCFRDVVRALRAPTSRRRPTWWRSRATSARSPRCSTGAASARVACIPYGGGSSVVGGVEARVGDGYAGAVSLDLGRLDRVLEIDRASRAARIQARRARPRARGPAPPARPHAAPLPAVLRVLDARRLDRDALGRSLRDALHPHRRLRRVAARGDADRRRRDAAPARLGRGARARPPLHRLRGHARRHHRGVDAAAGPAALPRVGVGALPGADGFARGAEAVRALAQSGLYPSNCRLLDAVEARTPAPGDDAVLLVALRVRRPPARRVDGARARDRGRDDGGVRARRRRDDADAAAKARARERPAPGATRSCARPTCATCSSRAGVVAETFETAITWDRFAEFHDGVMQATRDAVQRVCGAGTVTLPLHARRIPTAPRPTTRSSRRAGAAPSSSSGTRSRRPRAKR